MDLLYLITKISVLARMKTSLSQSFMLKIYANKMEIYTKCHINSYICLWRKPPMKCSGNLEPLPVILESDLMLGAREGAVPILY